MMNLSAGSPTGHVIDPSLFTIGSCVLFPPTSGTRHKTVFLDAGHGGIDPGGVGVTESGQTIYEADETLPVELDTTRLLRAQGFEVVDSRTRNSTVARIGHGDQFNGVFTTQGEHNDVAERDVCANRAKASILIGIYFDVGASPENAGSIGEMARVASMPSNEVLRASRSTTTGA
jgi:N-acetylmuramoyl-L-alanine amidase